MQEFLYRRLPVWLRVVRVRTYNATKKDARRCVPLYLALSFSVPPFLHPAGQVGRLTSHSQPPTRCPRIVPAITSRRMWRGVMPASIASLYTGTSGSCQARPVASSQSQNLPRRYLASLSASLAKVSALPLLASRLWYCCVYSPEYAVNSHQPAYENGGFHLRDAWVRLPLSKPRRDDSLSPYPSTRNR